MSSPKQRLETLKDQGVEIPAPDTVHIGEEVDLSRINGPDTVLNPGTTLGGERLRIYPGARLSTAAPATVINCAVGPKVKLSGGYFADAVFLDQAQMGSGAHVRTGTLLEEQANGAHTVGLKQTVLMPFVTLGSLINFCDVFMAGGTSRRDHSEVGSSYIHFNFTPFGQSGDKATASLMGDVPRGVMLRSPRIFLGGQGGLVGPVSIDYGAVLAAGFVYRRDHGPGQLVVGEELRPVTMPFAPDRYNRIRQKVQKNLRYIGNLVALWQWYEHVRLNVFALRDPDYRPLYLRAREMVESGIKERTKRLGAIAGYMEASMVLLGEKAKSELADQRAFADQWPSVALSLEGYVSMTGREDQRDMLLAGVDRSLATEPTASYVETIQGLDEEAPREGTRWLEGIVDGVMGQMEWP